MCWREDDFDCLSWNDNSNIMLNESFAYYYDVFVESRGGLGAIGTVWTACLNFLFKLRVDGYQTYLPYQEAGYDIGLIPSFAMAEQKDSQNSTLAPIEFHLRDTCLSSYARYA